MASVPTYGGSRPFPTTLRRATPGRSAGWTDLGASAAIAATAQPPISRIIVQVQPFRDRLFLGYGEWDVGLRSCDLVAWNTVASSYETVLAGIATDAIWNLRVVDDRLWALVTDPAAGTDPDAVVFDGTDVATLSSNQIVPWHLFDVAAWGGGIYVAGAQRIGAESHGAVWCSSDGGATWALTLDASNNQRIHGLFVLEDRLYAVGLSGQSWVTGSGTDWRLVDATLLTYESVCVRPVVAAGQAVYLSGWTAYGPQNLYAFDGQRVRRLAAEWTVLDAVLDADAAVILTIDGRLKRSSDLAAWEVVADAAPEGARSVGILDGVPYVGTIDGHLWRWTP